MGTSFMNHVAELYFRLQPKLTEGEFEALLKLLRKGPEKRACPPRAMGGRREDGPDGSLFFFREEGDGPVIFYCHGGSYIHDFSRFHWRLMRSLMDRTGASVIAPGYRLAPFGTWEDAFRLILPVYARFAREQPHRKLILMGDSAGGGLAASLALELQRRGERAPDELILLSPWMDVTIRDEEVADFIPVDPWLTTSHRVCGRCWAGCFRKCGMTGGSWTASPPMFPPICWGWATPPPPSVWRPPAGWVSGQRGRPRMPFVCSWCATPHPFSSFPPP